VEPVRDALSDEAEAGVEFGLVEVDVGADRVVRVIPSSRV
jgi:hypothetical protein